MKKTTIITLIAFFMLAMPTQAIIATDKISVSTASLSALQNHAPSLADDRVTRLSNYLESKHSPLAQSAAQLVQEADKNG